MKKILTTIISLTIVFGAMAQQMPERSDIRKGNKFYTQNKFSDAETAYRQGLIKNPESVNAKYNLANSLYKQERYEDAAKVYKEIVRPKLDSTKPANTYYNLGNAMLKQAIGAKEKQGNAQPANQEQLKKSIEAYKNALRLDPKDINAKYNLAYAQKLLAKNGSGGGQDKNKDNKNNKDKNNKDNKDKNNKNNQDKNKDNQGNNKDNKNNGDNNQNQDNKDNKDEKNDNKNKGQRQQPSMSKQDIDRMLEAVQAQEEKTKEKVDKEKAAAAIKSKPEKNW